MIKPTIGRIVWYYPNTGDEAPLAAIIVCVHSDTCVNLAFFDEYGTACNETLVTLYQGEDVAPRPIRCFCEWMPYQHGQAKKTEEAIALVERALLEEADQPDPDK